MKTADRKNLFLHLAKGSAEETAISKFYREQLVNKIWGFFIEYFLRYIDYKPYERVIKLDLWDETVMGFTDIRKNILRFLKPKNMFYIEFVREFCENFRKNFATKKETMICEDIRNWPFKGEFFDAIIDVSTSDHLTVNEFKSLIKDYRRTVKENGYIVLLHFNKNYFNIKNFIKTEGDPELFYTLNHKTVEKIIEENDLQIMKKTHIAPFILDTSLRTSEFYYRFLLLCYLLIGRLSFYLFTEFFSKYEKLNIMTAYLIKRRNK